MTGLIHWATGLLAASPLLVAAIVALFAAAESLLVVGAFVPGTTVILALAAAAGASGHGTLAVLLGAFAGAVVGDGLSYWIGHRYGPALACWGPIVRRPHLLASAERTVRERGAWAVFVARFLPAVRAIVPAAAGMLGMGVVPFYAANIASAAVWAASHVLLPALGGGALAALGGEVAALLVVAILLVGLAVWLARLVVRIAGTRLGKVRAWLHAFAVRREGRLSRALARTLDPADPSVLIALVWAALVVAAGVGFVGLAEDVATGDPVVAADLAVSRMIQGWRGPTLDTVMIGITMLGDTVPIATVALATCAWLAWRRRWRPLAAFALGMALALAFVHFVKAVLGRVRPLTDLYAGADAFSFPSGHTTSSAVLFGFLAVLVARPLPRPWRGVVLALLALLVLGIAFSRVYLQAHWPSDVVAGLMFGAALSAAFAIVVGHGIARPAQLGGVALAALVVAAAVHLPSGIVAARTVYAPRDLSIAMTEAAWREGGWREPAPGRVDIAGDIEAPFALQWIGDPAPLGAALAKDGWSPAPGWTLADLRALVGRGPGDPPPAPQLHLGRPPVAAWTRSGERADERLVLRLWASNYAVDGTPLLVGALEAERIARPLGPLRLPLDRLPPSDALDRLRALIGHVASPMSVHLLPPMPLGSEDG